MIDFPFQTYLFIYSLCTTPEFSEKQNKHYLKFCCFSFFFFALKGELNRKILLLRFLFCLAYIYIPQSLSYSTVTLKTGISIKVAFLCRGSICVDQSYWLIANSPLPSSIYILGANQLGGETTRRGGNDQGGNVLGAKRLRGKWFGGETSRIHLKQGSKKMKHACMLLFYYDESYWFRPIENHMLTVLILYASEMYQMSQLMRLWHFCPP